MPTERRYVMPWGINLGVDWVEELRQRAEMAGVTFAMVFGRGEIMAISLNGVVHLRVDGQPLITLRVIGFEQDRPYDSIEDGEWRSILGPRREAALVELQSTGRIGYRPSVVDIVRFRVEPL